MVSGGMGTARADIDWNLDRVPNLGQINNATLYLYLETFTGPNFLNITHIEKNSSQWSDNDAGNEQFFYDMRNGSIYYSIYSLVGGGGFPLPMSLNQQGMADINTALATDKRFSIGSILKKITISHTMQTAT
ncbi:hypothetical protein J4423_02225 [Candidatus Pacearchaeota archaeon]|nr:hypothetical protein [Candidatus Pacearchaeota archaeon]